MVQLKLPFCQIALPSCVLCTYLIEPAPPLPIYLLVGMPEILEALLKLLHMKHMQNSAALHISLHNGFKQNPVLQEMKTQSNFVLNVLKLK